MKTKEKNLLYYIDRQLYNHSQQLKKFEEILNKKNKKEKKYLKNQY